MKLLALLLGVFALARAVNPPRLTFSRGSKRCDLEYDGKVMNSKCDVTTDQGNCGLNDNCQRLDELEQNRVQALEAQNAQLTNALRVLANTVQSLTERVKADEAALARHKIISAEDHERDVAALNAAHARLTLAINAVTKMPGPRGEKGEKGDTGAQGAQGEVGAKGEKGEQGNDGKDGQAGTKGAKGEQGPMAPTPVPPTPAPTPRYAWKLIVKTSGGRMTSDLSAAQRQEMTSASKVAFAWNHGGSVSNAHDPMSYQMVAEVTSTGGGRPGWASSTRGGGGFQCSSSYYQRVKVNCIKGSCGMPSRMYIGTHSGHVCYNRAVGLVDNASTGNGQCDWHVDGQRFTSLYLGRPGDNGGCSKVTTTGGNRYIPAASAIFAWTDQSN